MKKIIKSALIALFSVSIFAACFALLGCNSNEKENYVDYKMEGFVYSVSGQAPLYVDADNMSPTDHLNYDSVIQMYGTKVSISDDYIEFNGTVLSTYGKIRYGLDGENVILAEPALSQMFNYVKLTNGIFYFGIQIEISGMTVTYSFEYYSYYAITPTYQVTFESQGGSSVNTATVTKGDAVTKPANPTRTGYTFGGWFMDSECKLEWDFTTNIYMDTTLYAKWNVNNNKVMFESNGGSTVYTKYATTGNKVSKPSDPSRTGYTFAGWYTESSLKNLYNFSAVVTNDMTLYAKWTPKQYTITFDANGGTCDTASKQVTFNTKIGELPTPTREHYIFRGWQDRSNGGNDYTSETFYTQDKSITLYAWWNVDTVVFNFNAQGGTCTETSKTYKYYEALGEMPVPEKEGNVFGGWFTQTGGKGDEYTAASVCDKTSETTLYAKWTADITLNYEGATSGMGAEKLGFTFNSSINVTLPQPYKTGYSFEGWFSQQDGQGTKLTNTKFGTSTIWKFNGNTDIYAYWVKGTDKRYINYTSSNGAVTITGLKDTTLKQIDIPAIIDLTPVKVIGERAFSNTGLTAVTLPDGLTTIGDSAFKKCSFTTITVPDSVTSIGYAAFNGCPLTEMTIPFVGKTSGITLIYEDLFGYIFEQSSYNETGNMVMQYYAASNYREFWCYVPTTLEKVTVTGDYALPSHAFSGCSMIKEINFTGKVKSIAVNAFSGCTKLQKITFSSEAPTLAENALANMSASTKIIVPDEYVDAYQEKFTANTVVGKSEEE